MKNAVKTEFIRFWGDRTPFSFLNEPFKEPSGTWIRVSVLSQPSEYRILTGEFPQRHGRMIIQIFCPFGKGTFEADTHASAIRDHFEGLRIGEVSFTSVEVEEIGRDGEWFQVNVACSFTHN